MGRVFVVFSASESLTGVQLRRRLGAGSMGGSEVSVDKVVAAVYARAASCGCEIVSGSQGTDGGEDVGW